MKEISLFLAAAFLFLTSNVHAHTADDFTTCIQKLIKTAPDESTLGEMRRKCTPQPAVSQETRETAPETAQIEETPIPSPVTERIAVEKSNIHKPFTIMAHRQNYLLPVSYTTHSWDSSVYQNTNGEEQLDLERMEVQFQLSIKMPLALNICNSEIDAYAGYTMNSFWQAYNSDNSAPFRETNHRPEAWLQRQSHLAIGPLKNVVNGIGIAHHSNGQGGTLSRSWNYIYATLGFELGDLAFIIKPWHRIRESADEDNNPDITEYLGHGELICAYDLGKHTFSFLSRNNLESSFSKGAVELGWSFPLFTYTYLRGYVQYFHGYGESLIDYDHAINRISMGLLLTDYL